MKGKNRRRRPGEKQKLLPKHEACECECERTRQSGNRVFGGKLRRICSVPGVNMKLVAKKKLSVPTQGNLSPQDCLKSLGVVENDITRLIFEYADRKALCPGLPVTAIAKKLWKVLDPLQPQSALWTI